MVLLLELVEDIAERRLGRALSFVLTVHGCWVLHGDFHFILP
jgi:hypothetical protein